jgi:hypothetical protein
MTDIVERLRGTLTTALELEAADEIERLRDHMRALANTSVERDTAGIFQGMWQASEQEVERLRAAIQRIDGINDNPAIYNPDIEAVVSTIYKRAGK